MARLGVLSCTGFGSTLFQTTVAAAALALSVMNTRPALVAAHIEPMFCAVRWIQATAPPRRVAPYARLSVSVMSVAPAGPIRTKSPQPGCVADVVNSGQLASRKAWLPPQSCVRQTENDPWKMEPAIAACGSAMIGGEQKPPSRLGRMG